MKKEIVAFVARCDNCCRVMAVHMKADLLQPCQFQVGNGKKLVWILSLDSQLLLRVMTLSG